MIYILLLLCPLSLRRNIHFGSRSVFFYSRHFLLVLFYTHSYTLTRTYAYNVLQCIFVFDGYRFQFRSKFRQTFAQLSLSKHTCLFLWYILLFRFLRYEFLTSFPWICRFIDFFCSYISSQGDMLGFFLSSHFYFLVNFFFILIFYHLKICNSTKNTLFHGFPFVRHLKIMMSCDHLLIGKKCYICGQYGMLDELNSIWFDRSSVSVYSKSYIYINITHITSKTNDT